MLITFTAQNCIRNADSPREYSNDKIPDYLLGKLLRELGPCEVETILAAPTSELAVPVAPGPGCPVPVVGAAGLSNYELLTLLQRIPEQKIIDLVKNVGAAKTVKLVRALRRHGCNYEDGIAPPLTTGELILPTMTLSQVDSLCSSSRFDYIGFLVDLVDRVNEAGRLGILINNQNLGGTQADNNLYLETIAYLGVYLTKRDPAEGMNKLVRLINNTAVANDSAHLVNNYAVRMANDILTGGSLDGKTCDGLVYSPADLSNPQFNYIPADCGVDGRPKNLINGSVDFIELKRLIVTLERLSDPDKIFPLIDGERSINLTDDVAQLDYLDNRLVQVLRGPNCSAAPYTTDPLLTVYCSATGLNLVDDEWVDRLIFLVDEIPNVTQIRDLLRDIDLGTYPNAITNLVEVVARVDFSGQTVNSVAPLTPVAQPASYAATSCATSNPWATDMGVNPTNSLRTLVYLVNNVSDQNKVIDLLQNSSSPQRLATVMDDVAYTSVLADDLTTCDLTAAGQKLGNIIETVSLAKIPVLADVVSLTDNVQKVSFLVNYLSIANSNKMGTVIDGLTDSTNIIEIFNVGGDTRELDLAAFPTAENGAIRTIAFTIDNMNNLSALSDLVNQASPGNITDLMNNVAVGTGCVPGVCDAGRKLVKIINNVEETPDVVFLLANVSQIQKISDIINQLSVGTWPVPADPLDPAYYDGAAKMSLLINSVAGRCSIASEYTRSACTNASGSWSNVYETNPCTNTEGNCWNFTVGSRRNATEMGKIVNLVEYGPAAADLAYVIVNVTDAVKMGALINRIQDSTKLTTIVNLVAGGPVTGGKITYTDRDDLVDLINDARLTRTDTLKLAGVIDAVGGITTELGGPDFMTADADQRLVAELIGPPITPLNTATFTNQGVGRDMLVPLIISLSDTDADTNGIPDSAERLGSVIANLNTNLTYNAGTVTKKQGLIRLMLIDPATSFAPNVYTPPAVDTNFPGIGPYHLAVMMNSATSANTLVTLLNGVNIADAIVTIGCIDHVGDYDGNGIHDGPTITVGAQTLPNPNFQTPCEATPGSGW